MKGYKSNIGPAKDSNNKKTSLVVKDYQDVEEIIKRKLSEVENLSDWVRVYNKNNPRKKIAYHTIVNLKNGMLKTAAPELVLSLLKVFFKDAKLERQYRYTWLEENNS